MTAADFKIDPNNLDVEWLRQAQLSRAAGRAEADARFAFTAAKSKLDVVEARLKFRVRADPEAFDLGLKPTVGEVAAAVILHPDYQAAEAAMNEAKRDLDYFSADVTAMVDRRKALERLVELIALDYYSEREPRPSSEKTRESVDAARRRAARGGD